MKTYSITEAARLIGVSTATVSRRLPADRASRGRSARLSVEEVVRVAEAIDLDPAVVGKRILPLAIADGMPNCAVDWAVAAVDRDLEAALERHVSRIPADLLPDPQAHEIDIELPKPWGEPGHWEPVPSQTQLEHLLPPER